MKSTSTALTNRIAAYKELLDPKSIDPTLDGGIKQDLLDTLNNKARSKALLKLSSIPSENVPTSDVGADGECYVYLSPTVVVYAKSGGAWSAVESSNDMLFFSDGEDGVRRYYSLSEDLLSIIEIHSIDFGDISGGAVKFTPQTLNSSQQTQARINIDAAAKSYVDNLFAQFLKSGAVGTECAGTPKAWFGLESTIPAGWAKIAETQTWFLKAEYPDLYAALGGESSPWGLTPTSFSIPWAPGGASFVKEGVGFPAFSKGGEKEHTLTINELPVHNFYIANDDGDGDPDVTASNTAVRSASWGGNSTYRMKGSSKTANVGKSSSVGGGATHNNMPPYVSTFWIIKLANSTNSAIIDSELSYKNVSITEMSAGGSIVVPAGLFIKDVNVVVINGSPTIEIPELSTGQMSGQDIYPISANYKSTGNLTINISGTGTIKVQIVKFNIQ